MSAQSIKHLNKINCVGHFLCIAASALGTLTSSGLSAWLCRAFWRSSTCCCSSVTRSRLSLRSDHDEEGENKRIGHNANITQLNSRAVVDYGGKEAPSHRSDAAVQREFSSVHLFSVSSSLRVLCASSSWACSAAIFSLSHSSCCTLSILFSCCSLMNFSLNKSHIQRLFACTHTKLEQKVNTPSEAVLPVLNGN